VVTVRRLIDGLWAAEPPVTAVNSLQALVSRLRKALPEGTVIESHPTGYRLAVPEDTTDVARFERLVAAGRMALVDRPAEATTRLREALSLWRGPALADAAGSDATDTAVAHLDELRLTAWEELAEASLRVGDAPGLAAELTALVTAHPLRERLVGLLMRAQCAAGRPAEALASYERLRSALADAFGVDPAPALAALHLELLRGSPTADPTRAEPAVAGNLRARLTSFVGREEELVTVGDLVRGARLTTLIGPGGAGKTRLAVECARAHVGAPDGAWLVELAPVGDPDELPTAVLAALGLRELPILGGRGLHPVDVSDPLARLVHTLAGRRLLLVLDNCEHLIGAAAAFTERVLGECPEIRVLATSREPLGITGETLWTVQPLALPPAAVRPGDALSYASVRLLADRAGAVSPGFTVDGGNVAAVAQLCRALDGMPLAIELAAARLRTMSLAQVAARLDDRFRLLTTGSRTVLPRHQTLRAVVDWSWDLLDDAERRLWRRLAVFSGGATLDAAVDVGGLGEDTLGLLTALVDKSILTVLPGTDEPRFGMLETIKAYGLERLAEAGESDVRAAHARHFLALAERAEPELRGRNQLAWLARLGADHDDLHAALRGAITRSDVDTALRFVVTLGWYWWLGGHRTEGTDLALEVLAMPIEGAEPELRALAYGISALNALDGQRDMNQVKQWFDEAIALGANPGAAHPLLRLAGPIADVIGAGGAPESRASIDRLFHDQDPWVRSTAHLLHAHITLNAGADHAEADAHLRTALATYEEMGERWGAATAVSALAEMAYRRGDLAAAAGWLERCLTDLTALGSRQDITDPCVRLARVRWLLGDRERAEAALTEADRVAAEVGLGEARAFVLVERAEWARMDGDAALAEDLLTRAQAQIKPSTVAPQFEALIATGLALVASSRGDVALARSHLSTAMDSAISSVDAPIIGGVLVGHADVALREGDARRAATLLGAAAGVRGAPDRSLYDLPRVEADARRSLGDEDFAEAYSRGLVQTSTEAVRALVADAAL
jgi:predicted ATPase/DNA-binding SARP family transcriptional activator